MTENQPEPEHEEPVPPPEESQASTEPPAAERPKAPGLKKPSGTQRVMYSLFSPETRTGRFLRGLLRTLALVVGMFALGLLATYLLLYRPAAQQLNGMRLQATQSATDLLQTRQDLTQARQDMQAIQTQVGQNQSRLEIELARGQVLRAINAVTQSRLAILNNNKPGAVKSLDTAQGYLQAAQPLLEKQDPKQASTLQALFTLAKNDLDRDFKLATQDLDRLQSELERADSNLSR